MAAELETMLPYILGASGAGIAGGIAASFWAPGINIRSAVQHFAAGVVIAAVASDVIPEVEKMGKPLGVILGFIAGGLVMIAMKWAVLRFERAEKAKRNLPFGLATAAAVDTLVDGAIISTGFATGQDTGSLLAIALAIELFFLTLSVGTEYHKDRKHRRLGILVTTGIALLLMVGALVPYWFLKDASSQVHAVFLSFGAAALIYLIAEELLVESFEAEENLFSTAMLFAGFAVILAIKMLGHH